MKDRNFVKKMIENSRIIPVIGMMMFLVVAVIETLFMELGPIFQHLAILGIVLMFSPIFLLQFALPAGLLRQYEIDFDVPLWVKALFYVVLFPFVNMLMLAAFNAAFHFLPNVHEVMPLAEKALVYEELRATSWTIIGSVYVFMVGSGLLFRALFYTTIKPMEV